MEKHVCPVCGYVHEDNDERKWEDLPADFVCPACSVEKDWFDTQLV